MKYDKNVLKDKKRKVNIPTFEPFYLIFLLPKWSVLAKVSWLQYSKEYQRRGRKREEWGTSVILSITIMIIITISTKHLYFSDIWNHIIVDVNLHKS